jgi:hypothetical protein
MGRFPSSMSAMTELPADDQHQVIRLGDEAAVVVPLEEYRRLRELERRARLTAQADEEEAAALAEYRAQQQAGTAAAVPQDEVRRRFGLMPE